MRWGEVLWRRPLLFGPAAVVVLVVLAVPVFGLRTAMPSLKVVPASADARVGYTQVQRAFGVGAPGELQVFEPTSRVGATGRAGPRAPVATPTGPGSSVG